MGQTVSYPFTTRMESAATDYSKIITTQDHRKVICSNATNIQIYGFCDSSEGVYGVCLHIHSTDNNNTTSCELCAATLLAMLYKTAINASIQ